MSRTPKVTLTATAVTLLCLGASLAASPQVIAETLGREVHAFSPADPDTHPGSTDREAARALDAATAAREQSTLPVDGQPVPHEPTTPKPDDAEVSARPDETATSLEPRPRATSEITQTEITQTEVADADAEATADEESTASPVEDDHDETDELPVPDVDSPDSLTVIVNKLRPLPEGFAPEQLVELPAKLGDGTHQLRAEAAEAAEALVAAAAEDDIELTVVSAYRSFAYQQELYDNYVSEYGPDATNGMSAVPGYSEHQTGLALDVDTPDGNHTLRRGFGDTEAGRWLAEHAHEYGFVIRYPEGAEDVTGFGYEPWHLRFFGEEYAQAIMEDTGIAETTFELDPAPDYAD